MLKGRFSLFVPVFFFAYVCVCMCVCVFHYRFSLQSLADPAGMMMSQRRLFSRLEVQPSGTSGSMYCEGSLRLPIRSRIVCLFVCLFVLAIKIQSCKSFSCVPRFRILQTFVNFVVLSQKKTATNVLWLLSTEMQEFLL